MVLAPPSNNYRESRESTDNEPCGVTVAPQGLKDTPRSINTDPAATSVKMVTITVFGLSVYLWPEM